MSTEIVLLPLRTNTLPVEVKDAATMLEETFETLKKQDGFQRAFWGLEYHDTGIVRMFVDWDSVEAHTGFQKKECYAPFLENLDLVVDISKVKACHVHLSPHPAIKAFSDNFVDVTEIMTFYFSVDITDTEKREFEDRLRAFTNQDEASEITSLATGWVIEDVVSPVTMDKNKACIACFGWKFSDGNQRSPKSTISLGEGGFTSLTAYFGIIDIGKVKAGDFVVVSGAAGATGSVAGQIAKIKGATVLGIAGSDSKCQWLKDQLGFDDALNYKDKEFASKFAAATEALIDVFYDNVGGEVLELALARAKPHSRFVMCGGVSQVNTTKPQGPRNYLNIIYKRIRMQGFLVFDYVEQFPQALTQLSQWASEGKISSKESVIQGGLSQAEKALHDIYSGVNTGKLLVEVRPA